jgi:hypothetical protein
MMRNASRLLLGVLLSGTTVLAQPEETSLQITLDIPTHFLSPDDQDVLLPEGAYLLEAAKEDSLRVVAIPEMEAMIIQAVAISHEEAVEHPTALSTKEENDEHHLILLMPDGKGYEAVGSYSGLQTRGTVARRLPLKTIRKRLSDARKNPRPRIPFGGRQTQQDSSGSSTSPSRALGGGLSQEKVRELERQRDQLKKIAKGKSIEASTKDFLAQEKMSLKKENALLAKSVDLLKNYRMPSIPDPCPKPQVEAKVVAPPIGPHEEIILNGCGFGDQRGELRLVSNAFPGGHVKLDILTWTRKAIHARVPALKGVNNAFKSQMLVVRKDLTLGDSFRMPFRATQSCELIKRPRLSVKCAESGACDYCLDCLKEKWGDFSFGGYHNPSPRINVGIDKASVNLGNGWYLQGMDYQWDDARSNLHGTHVIVGVPQGFKMKARKFTIKVPWTAWDMGSARYVVKLLACGPWGVPY